MYTYLSACPCMPLITTVGKRIAHDLGSFFPSDRSAITQQPDQQAHNSVTDARDQPVDPVTLHAISIADTNRIVGNGGKQTCAQLFGESRVLHRQICLKCQHQTEWVDVGGAHRRPLSVDHRHFGVEIAGLILVDLYLPSQQLIIECMRRVVLHAVFNPALQQQHDTDTALHGLYQGQAKVASGQKISVGNDDFALCTGNSLKVGAFDIMPMAQIITQYQSDAGSDNLLVPLQNKSPDFLAAPAKICP